jgi:hypothetical protein
MIEYLGWAATAVFVGSYFCRRTHLLKRVQMVGALMWATYGVLIGASPVVVANLLVFGAAAWTGRGDQGSGIAARGSQFAVRDSSFGD